MASENLIFKHVTPGGENIWECSGDRFSYSSKPTPHAEVDFLRLDEGTLYVMSSQGKTVAVYKLGGTE